MKVPVKKALDDAGLTTSEIDEIISLSKEASKIRGEYIHLI